MTGLHTAILALALTGAGTESTEPVLLDFSATWCGPCRQMDPVVDQLIAKGYPVKKVDFDRNRDLAQRFGVDRIPCFVMTVGGRETDRVLGIVPPQQLVDMFVEARKQAAPRVMPGPGELPLHPVANTKVQPQPIPLPAKRADAALAMESKPSPLGKMVSLSGAGSSAVRPAVAYGNSTESARDLTDRHLLAATVRLRVQDAAGAGCGTGTIIHAKDGQALILTCGHIFREYVEGGRINVDLFGSSGPQTVVGRLLSYDEDRDVGLLTIQAPSNLETIPVAPPGYTVEVGETVANVGCNHGDDPTVRRNKVTAIDRYLGPPNIEVAGRPVVGRSGGGLFSRDGYVIGVCNAADLQENEGVYAALGSIHQVLDDANLGFVYEAEPQQPVSQAAMVAVEDEPKLSPTMPEPNPIMERTGGAPNRPGELVEVDEAAPLSADEQRLLDELRQRRSQGAEIICIVRTKESPENPSEVFVFENASPQLLERLEAEGFARK